MSRLKTIREIDEVARNEGLALQRKGEPKISYARRVARGLGSADALMGLVNGELSTGLAAALSYRKEAPDAQRGSQWSRETDLSSFMVDSAEAGWSPVLDDGTTSARLIVFLKGRMLGRVVAERKKGAWVVGKVEIMPNTVVQGDREATGVLRGLEAIKRGSRPVQRMTYLAYDGSDVVPYTTKGYVAFHYGHSPRMAFDAARFSRVAGQIDYAVSADGLYLAPPHHQGPEVGEILIDTYTEAVEDAASDPGNRYGFRDAAEDINIGRLVQGAGLRISEVMVGRRLCMLAPAVARHFPDSAASRRALDAYAAFAAMGLVLPWAEGMPKARTAEELGLGMPMPTESFPQFDIR